MASVVNTGEPGSDSAAQLRHSPFTHATAAADPAESTVPVVLEHSAVARRFEGRTSAAVKQRTVYVRLEILRGEKPPQQVMDETLTTSVHAGTRERGGVRRAYFTLGNRSAFQPTRPLNWMIHAEQPCRSEPRSQEGRSNACTLPVHLEGQFARNCTDRHCRCQLPVKAPD